MKYTYKIISDIKTFDQYKSAWNELHKNAQANNPFLTFCWIRFWTSSFAGDSAIRIYLFFDDKEKLAAALPLIYQRERQKILNYRTLSFTANSHSFRSDLLVKKEYAEETLFDYVFTAILDNESFDYLKIREFFIGGDDNFEMLKNSASKHGISFSLEELKQPPYMQIGNDWEKYYKDRKGHFRRNLNRRMRKAEKETGALTYKMFNSEDNNLDDWVYDGFKLESKGWKGEQGSAVLKKTGVDEFYLNIARHFDKQGQFYSSAIFFGETMVAFNFSLIFEGVFYLLKVAYDEDYSRYSPGHIMIYYILQDVFEKGLKEFDFLGPSMSWKLEWAGKSRDHYTLYLYNKTLKSKILHFNHSVLLPMLRKNKMLRRLKDKISE